MANLYLLSYNNYFNRIIKKPYATISEYLDNFSYEAFFGLNFNPNDGLNTTHIFNSYFSEFAPNYLLVENEETLSFTRWFVVNTVRERGGQYRITLKRDILSDFYNETMQGVSFITKGFVSAENALIFNSENTQVNQIKKAEIPLRDSTRASWIVGYLAPNLAAEGDVNVSVSYEQETIPDIEDFEYSEYIGRELYGEINFNTSYYSLFPSDHTQYRSHYVVARYLNNTGSVFGTEMIPTSYSFKVLNKNKNELAAESLPINTSVFNTLLYPSISNEDISELLKLRNKVYKDGNVYKKVVFKLEEDVKQKVVEVKNSTYPNVYQAITQALTNKGITYQDGDIYFYITAQKFTLTLEEVGSPITQANVIFKSTIKQLKDAPYKMFCIPVSNNAILKVADNEIYTDKDKMIQMASSIATGLKTSADGFLYDIQLLPYCPIEDKFILTTDVNGIEYIGGGEEHKDFDIIRDNADNEVGYIFYCDRSSFTTNISAIGSIYYPSVNVNDPIDFKAKNETYMFRIVSPNYANSDNFNIFMNYGINYFNVDCTYKPFTPYIKLSINYKGLYGQDFDDQRGLILGGDFSLPVISDNWINYQIQNKNYAAIFDRETQHLEYQHKWNMASTITGGAVGTVAGAFMGSQLGSAALGGAISAGGGILDVVGTAATYGESMDYRKDTYQMNLQNIQALPQGLIKTSAFNYNSKLFPFVEIYHCTDVEFESVKNKIKYSGMTLNVIGSIQNYLNPSDITYIQGKVIRLDINEKSHIANAINSEIQMGVYYE